MFTYASKLAEGLFWIIQGYKTSNDYALHMSLFSCLKVIALEENI